VTTAPADRLARVLITILVLLIGGGALLALAIPWIAVAAGMDHGWAMVGVVYGGTVMGLAFSWALGRGLR
jgi:hypothetical protein